MSSTEQKTELEKDAVALLFALHDAWSYVHRHCTIESIKRQHQMLMRKHGDFADWHAEMDALLAKNKPDDDSVTSVVRSAMQTAFMLGRNYQRQVGSVREHHKAAITDHAYMRFVNETCAVIQAMKYTRKELV